MTLRRLLTQYLDPFAVPRRRFFEVIAHFSPPGHREREKLEEYLQPGDGTDDMYEYAQRVRRTMAEVLYEFTSVKIPVEYVMETFPLLHERQFSIASGPTVRGRLLISALWTSHSTGHCPAQVQNTPTKATRGGVQRMDCAP